MKKIFSTLTALIGIMLCFSLSAKEMTRPEFLKHFDQARDKLVDRYMKLDKPSMGAIEARYYTGKDVATADKMFLELLKAPTGDMFWMFPNMTAYLLGKDKMSDEVKKAVRNAWKTYAPSRGDTENHWALYHTTLFLAAEQWPDLPGSEWFNGKSSEENLKNTKEYLFHWAKLTTTIGQGEFDSPDYLPEYLIPMLMLAQWAQDEDVRQLGKMMADYVLADFAVEQLDQQYCGGHSRIYEQKLMDSKNSPSSSIGYLYFGVGDENLSGWCLHSVVTSYRTPEIIRQIALDRSKPYVEKETKRVRFNIRYSDKLTPPVYKYTYMTKDYGIGSLMGGLLQPIQQQTWSVRYNYGKPFNVIFGLHPYWSLTEIGMFFPEEVKKNMAGITSSKATYNNPNKWTGGSPYERTFQDKNSLIVLYDIPAGTTSEHIDGFFPANLQERIVDKSGWIMCKTGDVYIGWYPLQPYVWTKEYKVEKLKGHTSTGTDKKTEGALFRNYRLRSYNNQNGYVIEVSSKDQIGSFDKFKDALRTHIPEATLKPNDVSVSYTTINDDKMSFKFPDSRELNGKTVDLKTGKLFEGPFLNADVGSQMLTLTCKDMKMVLNFKDLTIEKNYK